MKNTMKAWQGAPPAAVKRRALPNLWMARILTACVFSIDAIVRMLGMEPVKIKTMKDAIPSVKT